VTSLTYRFYDKRSIPDWVDPYVCEDNRRLYFIEDFDNVKLQKVTKGDCFVFKDGKVTLVPKAKISSS